jgi:hypothetical protein|nr:MAG TPA: Head protein [Bacteriophage sp.]
MALENSVIAEKIWLEAGNDYQQRIPNPTANSLEATWRALFKPGNNAYLNQFMDVLVNRIAYTYVHNLAWTSPLAVFKRAKLIYGTTTQEIALNWVKAHAYKDDVESLLRLHRPEGDVAYHTQNRQDKYPISVVLPELKNAFLDDYGLNRLVAGIMQAPVNSDNYDEYRIALNMLATYEDVYGFYKYPLSAVPTDEVTGKEFLTAVRTLVAMLQFPSARYNAASVSVPVFAKPSELVLLVTPAVAASVSVEVLSSIFHVEMAEVNVRQIIVDEFPIPNVVAMLTTEDFFIMQDTLYETTSFWNAETLATNYYLHHWEIVSASPFVPAIMFTVGGDGTTIPTVKQTVTGITLTGASTAEAGEDVQLTVNLTGTLAPVHEGVAVEPDAATFAVAATDGSAEPKAVELDPMSTYVDKFAVLHLADDLPAGTVVTVTATSAYVNPSAATTHYTAAHVVTITDPTATESAKPTVQKKRTGKGASGTTDTHGNETATDKQ